MEEILENTDNINFDYFSVACENVMAGDVDVWICEKRNWHRKVEIEE